MSHTRIAIRTLRATDFEDIHELMLMPQVLWGTPLLPSTSLDSRRAWLENWLKDEQIYTFVAEVNQKVVGFINLTLGKGRSRHTGDIGLAVHDAHQGQGIGKMLMLTIIDLADNWLNLYRLELKVYTDNERAINLYTRFDFAIEGRKRADSFRGGNYADSYIMGRLRPQQSNPVGSTQTSNPVEQRPDQEINQKGEPA